MSEENNMKLGPAEQEIEQNSLELDLPILDAHSFQASTPAGSVPELKLDDPSDEQYSDDPFGRCAGNSTIIEALDCDSLNNCSISNSMPSTANADKDSETTSNAQSHIEIARNKFADQYDAQPRELLETQECDFMASELELLKASQRELLNASDSDFEDDQDHQLSAEPLENSTAKSAFGLNSDNSNADRSVNIEEMNKGRYAGKDVFLLVKDGKDVFFRGNYVTRIPLNGESLLVGRRDIIAGHYPDIDLAMYWKEDHTISRNHLRIFADMNGAYFIEDICSKNMTFLNNYSNPVNGEVIELHPGDCILISRSICIEFCVSD